MKRGQREERNSVIIERIKAMRNKTTEMRRLAEEYGLSERQIRNILKKI